MVLPSFGFIMGNYLIVFCLLLFSEIQLSAWVSKFANSTDADVQMQFSRVQISSGICILVTILAPISHILCVHGLLGSIKLLRVLTLIGCIQIVCFSLSFSILFMSVLCPSTKAQTLVTSLFQVSYAALNLSSLLFLYYLGRVLCVTHSEFGLSFGMCRNCCHHSARHHHLPSPSIQTA